MPPLKTTPITTLVLILASLASGVLAVTAIQERKTKLVTRVKRPVFSPRDWDGVYFENLFEEGLVGERPDSLTPSSLPSSADSGLANTAATGDSSDGAFVWSQLIDRTTIEDEVKALQAKLAADITTPVKFKSDYAKVNQSFSILSMLFGIIREYDAEVRWQDSAGEAQASFERAAANSRVGTIQAYESCQRRAVALAELVRGSKFSGDEKPPENLDWGQVVDRPPLMDRLQESMDQLKKLTANQGDFSREMTAVTHESEIVAAIAAVLARENMPDADDSQYKEFADTMRKSAVAAASAVESKDFAEASKQVNLIGQACANCHSEWR